MIRWRKKGDHGLINTCVCIKRMSDKCDRYQVANRDALFLRHLEFQSLRVRQCLAPPHGSGRAGCFS